jgi:hypothetical protein
MKKDESMRQFSFSDGTLKQYADQAVLFATRDAAEFVQRGYSAARLAAIQQQSDDFGAVTSDEEMLALQMLRTEAKDKKRDVLEEQLRTVFAMASNAFGAKSIQLRRFGDGNLSKQTDNDLIRTARVGIKTANEYLTELGAEGLTAAFLTATTAQTQAFDEALDAQQLAISDREIAKETRIEAANALYNELVKLSNTGKSIFRTLNEAKYNDYVIYDTPSGKAPEPPVVTP